MSLSVSHIPNQTMILAKFLIHFYQSHHLSPPKLVDFHINNTFLYFPSLRDGSTLHKPHEKTQNSASLVYVSFIPITTI